MVTSPGRADGVTISGRAYWGGGLGAVVGLTPQSLVSFRVPSVPSASPTAFDRSSGRTYYSVYIGRFARKLARSGVSIVRNHACWTAVWH